MPSNKIFSLIAQAASMMFVIMLNKHQQVEAISLDSLNATSEVKMVNYTLMPEESSELDLSLYVLGYDDPVIPCTFVADKYAVCGDIALTPEHATHSAQIQACGYKSYLPAFARRSESAYFTQQIASVNVAKEVVNPSSNPFAPLFMNFSQDAETIALATPEITDHITTQVADDRLKAAIAAYASRGR